MSERPDYDTWLYWVGELHEDRLDWDLPAVINESVFPQLLRALYLADYGPSEARNFIDNLLNRPTQRPIFHAKKTIELMMEERKARRES